jgi:hypothetical protein
MQMDVKLLSKLFGHDQRWHGPCTVVVDADASVCAIGADSIGSSATKSYAPRLVSGRIAADAACFLLEGSALLTIQQQKIRQGPNEEIIKQSLTVIDASHVIAVEFQDTSHLSAFGLGAPTLRTGGSQSGVNLRSNI